MKKRILAIVAIIAVSVTQLCPLWADNAHNNSLIKKQIVPAQTSKDYVRTIALECAKRILRKNATTFLETSGYSRIGNQPNIAFDINNPWKSKITLSQVKSIAIETTQDITLEMRTAKLDNYNSTQYPLITLNGTQFLIIKTVNSPDKTTSTQVAVGPVKVNGVKQNLTKLKLYTFAYNKKLNTIAAKSYEEEDVKIPSKIIISPAKDLVYDSNQLNKDMNTASTWLKNVYNDIANSTAKTFTTLQKILETQKQPIQPVKKDEKTSEQPIQSVKKDKTPLQPKTSESGFFTSVGNGLVVTARFLGGLLTVPLDLITGGLFDFTKLTGVSKDPKESFAGEAGRKYTPVGFISSAIKNLFADEATQPEEKKIPVKKNTEIPVEKNTEKNIRYYATEIEKIAKKIDALQPNSPFKKWDTRPKAQFSYKQLIDAFGPNANRHPKKRSLDTLKGSHKTISEQLKEIEKKTQNQKK